MPPDHRSQTASTQHDHDHGHGHGHDQGHTGHPGHTHGQGHHHGHGHHHPPPTDFSRAFAIGIALNLGFVLVEAAVGWRVDSLALLADAGHNLSDVAGLVLAWAGAAAARLAPNARRTYGWKRAGIVAAVANALLLLVAMGALGWEAAQRLAAPVPVPGWPVVWVAAAGIVVNGATALLFMRGSAHDLNIRGAFLHMAGDALVSAGVVASGLLAIHFGGVRLDAVASLLIAVIILASSWGLLRQSLHLLFDGVPEHIDLPAVEALLRALPGVSAVHDLHVWAMGTTETALTAHLVMPAGGADDAFLQQATQQLQARFGIAHVTLQPVRMPFMPGCQPGVPHRAG